MAITTQDGLVAALAAGYSYAFPPINVQHPSIYNAGSQLGMTSSWFASSRAGTIPAQIGTPSTCGASTPGAMPLPALTAGNRYYLGGLTLSGQSAVTVMILDRLAQIRINPASGSEQWFNNMVLPARVTNSVGVLPFFEIATSDLTSSSLSLPTMTLYYTNHQGLARTGSGHVHGPAATSYERAPGGMIPFMLAQGDRGVRSLDGFTFVSAAMGATANVLISLCRPVYVSHLPAQAWAGQQLGFYDLGGIDLGTDPCLFYAVSSNSGSGSTPPPTVVARIIQG